MKPSKVFLIKTLIIFGSLCAVAGTLLALVDIMIADPLFINNQPYSFSGYFYFSALTYAIGFIVMSVICCVLATLFITRRP